MDDQVLRAIDHIKYVSKKKPSTVKIVNYLQNNGALNYDYESLENEIAELRNNGTELLMKHLKQLIQSKKC